MIDPVISLNGLGKRFGQTIAVDGISMVIGKGAIFGFLGANGAGKTTTIRMLCGLTRPTCGHGAINGLDIWRQRSRLHWQFGYVPQWPVVLLSVGVGSYPVSVSHSSVPGPTESLAIRLLPRLQPM